MTLSAQSSAVVSAHMPSSASLQASTVSSGVLSNAAQACSITVSTSPVNSSSQLQSVAELHQSPLIALSAIGSADSTKCLAEAHSSGAEGLLECADKHDNSCSSRSAAIQPEPAIHELLGASGSSTSAGQSRAQDSFQLLHPTTAQHLVAAKAASATAGPVITSADRSQPSVIRSSPGQSLSSSSHSHPHHATGHVGPAQRDAMEEERKMGDAAPASAAAARAAPASSSASASSAHPFSQYASVIKKRKQQIQQARALASQGGVSESDAMADSVSRIDLTCHCLVINDTPFAVSSIDRLQFQHVVASCNDIDKHAAQAALLSWQPSLNDAGPIIVRYDAPTGRVHLNFETVDGLSLALRTTPILTRCGSLPQNHWAKQSDPCGKPKHEQPEMLQFSCNPKPGSSVADIEPAIARLCTEMKLDITCRWTPGGATWQRGQQQAQPRIRFNVHPRDTRPESLRSLIERLESERHMLLGGTIHVHAPNMPELARCKHCAKLGHSSDACPIYSGLAVRLLFQQPIGPFALTALVSGLGARTGYLSSRMDLTAPHRKVTLLFDIFHGDENQTCMVVFERLVKFDLAVLERLHEDPTQVHTNGSRGKTFAGLCVVR
jgi:hypothetical protein